jgi:hypothetical protein
VEVLRDELIVRELIVSELTMSALIAAELPMGELAASIHLVGGIEMIMRGQGIVPTHSIVGAGDMVVRARRVAMVRQVRGMTVAR